MKYAVMGTGGTGGCIGGYLAAAGRDVDLIARGEHLKAIKQNGLTVESSDRGIIHIPGTRAFSAEEYGKKADVIFVCVKYYSLGEAVEFVKRASHSGTAVIPVLNVFGTGREMQSELPSLTVTDGCIYIYAYIKEYGVIAKPSDIFRVVFGTEERVDKRTYGILKQAAMDMTEAGIEANLSNDVKKDTFRKFTYISPVAAAGLYCNARAADFLVPGRARDVLSALTEELLALGKAMGIEYEEDMLKANLDIIAGLDPDADTSMQRDIRAGRRSEADGLIARVARKGRALGVPMPTYDIIADKYKYL